MVELGKRSNGVTIFDNDDLLKIHIILQSQTGFIVSFDSNAYDQFQDPCYCWGTKSMTIDKYSNPQLCVPLNNLYTSVCNMITSNSSLLLKYSEYVFPDAFDYKNTLYYISDDALLADATMFSLEKYKEYGFSLDLYKSDKDEQKTSVLFSRYKAYFPEFYQLYENCFNELIQMASKPYEECQEEFNKAFIKRSQMRN